MIVIVEGKRAVGRRILGVNLGLLDIRFHVFKADSDLRAVANDIVAGLLDDLSELLLRHNVEDVNLERTFPCGVCSLFNNPFGHNVLQIVGGGNAFR